MAQRSAVAAGHVPAAGSLGGDDTFRMGWPQEAKATTTSAVLMARTADRG
ncbi:hypothetical protein QN239_02025 [Mycolicibacterium sp. Y3]